MSKASIMSTCQRRTDVVEIQDTVIPPTALLVTVAVTLFSGLLNLLTTMHRRVSLGKFEIMKMEAFVESTGFQISHCAIKTTVWVDLKGDQ
jgi:hypothetical protein